MRDAVLEVRNLTIRLKIEKRVYSIVQEIFFNLRQGETLALVGESGCGKTMTALALMRILPEPPFLPSEGEILYQKKNLLTFTPKQMRTVRGKNISMIFQDPLSAFNPVYTIGFQLFEVVKQHLHIEGAKAKITVIQALEDVQLSDAEGIMNSYPHQLSGGMLQRAMIAMALIGSPDILLADEPTTALDVTIQSQILQLLRELQDKKGMATLLITHDMNVVAQNADEVVVMYAGDHIEKGHKITLLNQPAHPYTQTLLSCRPNQAAIDKKLPTIPGSVPRISQIPQGCPFHPRCSQVMDACKSGEIPWVALKDIGHETKCLLYTQAT